MPDPTPPPPAVPLLPLETVLSIVASPIRWRIFNELVSGEQLMVTEIAERTSQTGDVISKHLAVLRDAGIVSLGRNRLYRLQPQFIADASQRLVDFGWCLLRLNTSRP